MTRPSEYLKIKYMAADCKCGDCQLVPASVLAGWAELEKYLPREVWNDDRTAASTTAV